MQPSYLTRPRTCYVKQKKDTDMFISVLKIRRLAVPSVREKVENVVTHMTGNPDYATPNPSLATITTENNILGTLYQSALTGDRVYKALMRTQLNKVFGLMSLLTGYVQVTSGGDEEKILGAGFLTKRSSTPVGILPFPGNVRVVFGKHPGELKVMWAGVPKRTEYRVQMSVEPITDDSWEDAEDGFTGKTRLVIEGLESGNVYWFRVFTLGAAGISGPSDPASHMAP